MKEIWKKIENYEDYEISNLGNVKSLKRKQSKLLSFKKSKFGYCIVGLSNNNNKNKKFFVHRLVADAFLDKGKYKCLESENININNLEVNHIDGNKQNNRIDNLEWCSRSYNQKHSYIIGLKANKKNYDNYRSKNICQYNLDGVFIKKWANKRDIERTLGYSNANIVKCCKGQYKTSYGYIWEYEVN